MNETLTCKELSKEYVQQMVPLGKELNPELSLSEIQKLFVEMFELDYYRCFGLFKNDELIGICSGWITIRLYSGKQLELDNVVVAALSQSKGYGDFFMGWIEHWAKMQGCKTLELNSYVDNARSHKFYFKQGYSILGFHFLKTISS